MTIRVTPFALKDTPALIERLLPVQKLSAEAYKEQMAGSNKTLTALGSYWKGRKPLTLAKACVLGCLLPATGDDARDLEIFEKLMAMDDESFVARWKRRPKPKEVLATLAIARIADYFTVEPEGVLAPSSPVDWSKPEYKEVKVAWRDDIGELERRRLEAQMLPRTSYRERVAEARRPEEVMDTVHEHIWEAVNAHLGTDAHSFSELVEHLGIMRFGHRPRVADTFCGSGQIPFEAARLGCDVYASDLNPVACLLSWGALNIVGGSKASRQKLEHDHQELVSRVQAEIEALGVETDGRGWRAKVFLCCVEVRCPQSGWMVPLLPTLVISKGYRVIAELVPDPQHKRYDIAVRSGVTEKELQGAARGTVSRESRFSEAYLEHQVDGVTYKTKISTLRGDFQKPDGTIGNRVRLWEKQDFKPRPDDIFQERLYCVQWMRRKRKSKRDEYEFRAVTPADLERERVAEAYIDAHLTDWQARGWVPDMRIEPGGPPRYEGLNMIRGRGWTHWNHLWNARQLIVLGLMKQQVSTEGLAVLFAGVLDYSSKLSRWTTSGARMSKDGSDEQIGGASNSTANVFYNQALNAFYNYGLRSAHDLLAVVRKKIKQYPTAGEGVVSCQSASEVTSLNDLFITDPPYGDAVKYEEILDFFVAWLRKNPPPEFAKWVWDSRRTMAIKGEDESFRRDMVAAYSRMTECMPDNGIQVIMFTHQSGAIWADMASIVWASGLQVTAAWYVATETDSALREGSSHVKGTVLLVCRKRLGMKKASRTELAWDLEEAVQEQVEALTGLNQRAKGLYRDENVFEDVDLQMAGYAAALRVLTQYTIIDGRDMAAQATRPRVKGQATAVDELIAFAVDTANQFLVPLGIDKGQWKRLKPVDRFYLKMIELEARGARTLDNYQNFAKAFKVRNFASFMGSDKANAARLRSAVEVGRGEMGESSEFSGSVLRAVLYALMELAQNMDGNDVLAHLTHNIPDYMGDMTQAKLAIELADYLAQKLETLRPNEASAARVLGELIRRQRLG